MHDSPSSPRRSIAPAPPKLQQAKKAGAPKAKGAVRAKSGCYTCRIRRKKCDERPNAEGRCETCIRLRLQCLGFGQKRPDWLKENNNVTQFRERIKEFLAAQGMIKGHSGSGTRTSEQEGMLVLINDHGRSDTSSPQSPALSVDSSEDHRRPTISSLRNDPHYTSISLSAQHSHPGYPSHRPAIAPPILVPSQAPVSAPTLTSHFTSTLPPSYQHQYAYEEEDYDGSEQLHSGYIEHSLNQSIVPFITSHQSGQYLLADSSIAAFIIRTVQQNPAVRDAVCLLASLHQESLRRGNPSTSNALALHDEPSSDSNKTYKRICENLCTSAQGGYTEGEAMAGLFVVSAFLFRGGHGAWQHFLTVAADWVWNVLHTGPDPISVILRCSDSQQFVIKTTFWFDILASTTRLEPPRFLAFYRKLCSGGVNGSPLSMMNVMGCENETALAIAETSALACWKVAQERQCKLSVPDLVDRGRQIEKDWGVPDELSAKRRLTADIFRATARVYLHSVISGEHPGCPEIRDGVHETIECLRRVPRAAVGAPGGSGSSSVARSVLRSVVFGICLCGCLADDPEDREFLLRRLDAEEQAEGVGNCASARLVMQEVWRRRAPSSGVGGESSSSTPSSPPALSWREATQQFGGESLLLV
ncbi:fungal-specific transcription factor domain-containing protein [Russula vinacea]|nr:fungal-specific transcription factor domain-containing protein [Russula vinacea]